MTRRDGRDVPACFSRLSQSAYRTSALRTRTMHEKSEDKKPRAGRKVKIERLELNKETVRELTDLEAQEVEGGVLPLDIGTMGSTGFGCPTFAAKIK